VTNDQAREFNDTQSKSPTRIMRICHTETLIYVRYSEKYLTVYTYTCILVSMTIKEKAAQALAACEKGLRDLLAEAAQVGDYDVVALLTECAREVGQIASQFHPEARSTNAQNRTVSEAGTSTSASQPAGSSRAPKSPRRSYPKFIRRENELIKIGWSKGEKREYEHKAPFRVLQPLIDALAKAGTRGKRFSIDQLLPLSEADGTVPDYQVYAMFGWLKHAGLIRQHGRGSYSLQNAAQLFETVQQAWSALPQDRADKP
jgi:hypothetical protein